MWFLFVIVYSRFWPVLPLAVVFCGMDTMLFTTPVFWFGLVLIPVTTLLIDVICKLIYNTVFKSITEAVRESEIRKNDPSHVLHESRSS
ncbi:probable phospholipid-transporting ATPase IA [Teleopsis dalmanni]|nr:probable phospholipid-transporting ATPase IA [Teleopsis dalmanni]